MNLLYKSDNGPSHSLVCTGMYISFHHQRLCLEKHASLLFPKMYSAERSPLSNATDNQ